MSAFATFGTLGSSTMNLNQNLHQVGTPDLLHWSIKFWNRAWPCTWFAWVVVLSLQPSWKREFHTKGPLHAPGHALIFAVSAFIACRSAQSVSQRFIRCAAVIGLGGALEALQSWIFRSRFEWDDVVTDACGVLLFLLVAACVDSIRRPWHSVPEPYADPVNQTVGLTPVVIDEPLLRCQKTSGDA